jgi:hypothetical protein
MDAVFKRFYEEKRAEEAPSRRTRSSADRRKLAASLQKVPVPPLPSQPRVAAASSYGTVVL